MHTCWLARTCCLQNARPQGPAVWLLAEALDRLLRWAEDDYVIISETVGQRRGEAACIVKDQVGRMCREGPGRAYVSFRIRYGGS